MTTTEHTPVLIAGGGPCGLMLAIELGRRGVPLILVDAKPGTALNPQANATQARTMEHYRRLGFANEVRALGLPPDYPTDIAYFTRYAGHELARFRLPSARQAGSIAPRLSGSWSAAELPHRVSQKFVEQVLRRHAAAIPTSQIRYSTRLVEFTEAAKGVRATTEDAGSGEQREIAADYLIGADGPRSLVRRQLGIGYAGETGVVRDFFGGRMVAVHLRAPDFYRVTRHAPAWMYWAFNTERRSWLASVNGIDEFAFHTQLRPEEEQEIVSPERARALFHQVMGIPLDIELLAIDTWTAGHALVAESFGRDRVWIGGDAAHLFTPAGGLGYNTAIEDSVNLGWKLASVVKGRAGAALLGSYGLERKQLARRNTGYARALAESIGNFVPVAAIEAEDAQGEAARVAAGTYLEAHARREFDIPGITFGGRYDGSPLIIPDGTAPPPDAANSYVPSACPGGRAPHLWLEDGRSLFDLFGFEWTLLRLGPDAPAGDGLVRAARECGINLAIIDVPSPAARALYEAPLALIRPDQIVAWRGPDDNDAANIFRQFWKKEP